MQWTSLNDLREKFLLFFESKDHLRLPSFPLVPINDKSLLLINAGMAPMKKFFTGEEKPPRSRVATCQKCVRMLDIDNIGKTARHGTYFEMLGNFSFGDYFKEDAIPWAWEFFTKWLEIPAALLYPSIFEEDEEAFEIWNKKIGVPAEKIIRLGRKDNFWEHGSGPCGPCSEIYFDRGEKTGCGSPDCRPGCDCDRFMEIWNNVFTQFNSDGKGNYTELASKNIDTGMGLERLACIMQGVDSLFEVDTIRKILDTVCDISGVAYGADYKSDVSIRIITDHIRGTTFLISDGVLPSNEGRGYVLRRLIRRAARHGRLLGINNLFLNDLCEVVINQNIAAYPDLKDKMDFIKQVIRIEEERFNSTIDSGLNILSSIINKTIENGSGVVSGDDIFKLYDTFGFPLDLSKEIVEEKGLSVDEDVFTELMNNQKKRARDARGDTGSWKGESKSMLESIPATDFVGYTANSGESKIIAILVDGEIVQSVNEGCCTIILDSTVFYGESGGQVGDIGIIESSGALASVVDAKKVNNIYLHSCEIENGTFTVGDTIKASVDAARRMAIKRNHSSAHLLQSALRNVLGSHVEQAGSYVDSERVRFDFKHITAMTADEIRAAENLVNEMILSSLEITTTVTDIETARSMGALALFGEKYGETVRVVKMGDFSTEFCGGTHCTCTSNLGLFKILSESSVASGVRRIEGTTGFGVIHHIYENLAIINETAQNLKTNNPSDIVRRSAQIQTEIHEMKREIDSLNSKLASVRIDELITKAVTINSIKLITTDLGETTFDIARNMCDTIKEKYPSSVTVFAIKSSDASGEKLNFIAACGKTAITSGAHAGNILKTISPIAGGNGGGRAESASSGIKDPSKIQEALAKALTVISEMINA